MKKLEIQLPGIANPKHPESTESTEAHTLVPSPTMPTLEDANVRFLYCKTNATEVFLPPETTAKLIQTFPGLVHNTTVSPHVVELAQIGPKRLKP